MIEKKQKPNQNNRKKKIALQEETTQALLNILEDVEKEKARAEEERNKTLSVITHLTDGLLVFDKKNKLSLINYQAEKFLNIRREEVLEVSITELINLPNFKMLGDLLGPEIKLIFRKELDLADNLIIEVSTEPMLPKGEKIGTLVVLHDISREKAIERIKSEFVSLAAHQLRTPLSAIKWTLKMLLDGDLGNISKEQREFVKKTYKSNERMIDLINDLLDVTRIEEGRFLSKLTIASFEKMATSVLDFYQQELIKGKIDFKFKKSQKKLPQVNVDIEKVKLAIQNLIENAIKYTPPGGKINVIINYDKEKKEIIFSVEDSGVGIPEEEQARVFTKFFRGENVVRMDTEGTGLGLFISKNIIEAHQGKIWFKSKKGEGTTFSFSLPVERDKYS